MIVASREPAGPPRVLLVAPHGSYRTGPFLAAARRLGLEPVVASGGRHSVVAAYAQGLHLDLADEAAALAAIEAAARERPFAGVVATDDATTELAARAAARLGLPHNPPEAVRLARRKDLARARLAAAGVRVPQHRVLDPGCDAAAQAAALGFPAVVKPVALAGSRGVIRVDDEAALAAAVERVRAILAREDLLEPEARSRLLLERFIPGAEVAVEGMLDRGRLRLLAVFDKPDPLDGPFFEETYYVTPTRHPPEVVEALQALVESACAAYGLREGPVHAECRINAGGVWLIELAARTIGGLCARLLGAGTGHGLEELVLAWATGRRPVPAAPAGAAGVLMIPIPAAGVFKRVEGILEALRVPGIEDIDIQVREGHTLVPLPEGSSYLGFIFARGDDPAAVEAALREAHARLRIVVAPLWTLAPAPEAAA